MVGIISRKRIKTKANLYRLSVLYFTLSYEHVLTFPTLNGTDFYEIESLRQICYFFINCDISSISHRFRDTALPTRQNVNKANK